MEKGTGKDGSTGFTDDLLKAEAKAILNLWTKGLIREIDFRSDTHEAVIVMEVPGPDDCRRILSQLPLVEAGLITFEIIPLQPYDGFTRLLPE